MRYVLTSDDREKYFPEGHLTLPIPPRGWYVYTVRNPETYYIKFGHSHDIVKRLRTHVKNGYTDILYLQQLTERVSPTAKVCGLNKSKRVTFGVGYMDKYPVDYSTAHSRAGHVIEGYVKVKLRRMRIPRKAECTEAHPDIYYPLVRYLFAQAVKRYAKTFDDPRYFAADKLPIVDTKMSYE